MNIYIKYILIFIAILYSGLIKSESFSIIKSLVKNPLFKLLLLSYIVYVANYDPKVATIITICYIITNQYINEDKVKNMD